MDVLVAIAHLSFAIFGNVDIWCIIAADSLISAVRFLAGVVTGGRPVAANIEQSYLYYAAVVTAYYYMSILTYGNVSPRWFFAAANPTVVDIVINNAYWYQAMYRKYKTTRDSAVRAAGYRLMSHVSNVVCRDVLQCEAGISDGEIAAIFDAYEYRYVYDFVRVVVVVNIVATVDRASAPLGKVIRALYTRGKILDIGAGLGYVDPFVDAGDAKTKIRRIVLSRRWDLFYNPKILETLVELYESEKNGGLERSLREIGAWLETIVARFFAVWTLTSMVPHYSTHAVISLVIFAARRPTPWEVVFKIAGTLVYVYTGSAVISAAVSELTDMLWNRGTNWVCRVLKTKLRRASSILSHYNRYNWHIALYTLLMYGMYCVAGVYCVALVPFLEHPWIACWASAGVLSGFGSIHILLSTLLLYVTINVANCGEVAAVEIDCRMIQSYYVERMPVAATIFDDYSRE